MSQKQGFQVFDNNGNVTVDVTDSLTRVLGTATITGGETLIIYNNAFVRNKTRPFIYMIRAIWVDTGITPDPDYDYVFMGPDLSVGDGFLKLSYWHRGGNLGSRYCCGGTFLYGVY